MSKRQTRRFETPTAPRDLRRGARGVPDWRVTRDGRAQRLGPREHIVIGQPTSGPWKDRDPRRTPRWWGVWRWIGLVFWAGLLGESTRRAWKQHGGLPQRQDEA